MSFNIIILYTICVIYLFIYFFFCKIVCDQRKSIPPRSHCFIKGKFNPFAVLDAPRLDFRRFLESGLRSCGSFPEQRLVIEPTMLLFLSLFASTTDTSKGNMAQQSFYTNAAGVCVTYHCCHLFDLVHHCSR